jgi:hypothetical protein
MQVPKETKDLATKAANNIMHIVLTSIQEAIGAGELPKDIEIESIRVNTELIEIDLSNDTTMQIELGLPH